MFTEVDLQHPTLHHWHHSCLFVGSDQRSCRFPPSLDPLPSDKGELGHREGCTATYLGSTELDIEGMCRRLWRRRVYMAVFSYAVIWRRTEPGGCFSAEIGSIELIFQADISNILLSLMHIICMHYDR